MIVKMIRIIVIAFLFLSNISCAQFFGLNRNYNTVEQINYGYLYNWYAVDDVRDIANIGWSVPDTTDFYTLDVFLGGISISGDKLREVGVTYWDSPNTGATNSSKFNGRGSGQRDNAGVFGQKGEFFRAWTIPQVNTLTAYMYIIEVSVSSTDKNALAKKYGVSVRLIKDSTTLSDGEEGLYIGNDGKVYRTICIGTQEWLADNLAETKYQNGDAIPEVTDGTTWAGLSTGARCVYDNDEANR